MLAKVQIVKVFTRERFPAVQYVLFRIRLFVNVHVISVCMYIMCTLIHCTLSCGVVCVCCVQAWSYQYDSLNTSNPPTHQPNTYLPWPDLLRFTDQIYWHSEWFTEIYWPNIWSHTIHRIALSFLYIIHFLLLKTNISVFIRMYYLHQFHDSRSSPSPPITSSFLIMFFYNFYG